ncbi:unnamed protein product [Periconia digitata]|uniref:Uncharacterized protein n=1 Tax=Periconia digitata TaxID=1303443 RepID=A0A9W4XTR7_9PLEO|nr:unnamed protein product [Periconia digitata]
MWASSTLPISPPPPSSQLRSSGDDAGLHPRFGRQHVAFLAEEHCIAACCAVLWRQAPLPRYSLAPIDQILVVQVHVRPVPFDRHDLRSTPVSQGRQWRSKTSIQCIRGATIAIPVCHSTLGRYCSVTRERRLSGNRGEVHCFRLIDPLSLFIHPTASTDLPTIRKWPRLDQVI